MQRHKRKMYKSSNAVLSKATEYESVPSVHVSGVEFFFYPLHCDFSQRIRPFEEKIGT